jgi:hypothetical protein
MNHLSYDIEACFQTDFNYKGMYYNNDSPEYWKNYKNVKSAIGDTEFSYELSSFGFRCDEFDKPVDLSVMFLGCSNTFGLGLPLEKVWANVICNRIKDKTGVRVPYWNIAKNGSSIDLQFLLLEKYVDKLKPKFIFFLIPGIYRRTFYYDNWFYRVNFSESLQGHIVYPKPVSNTKLFYINESVGVFEAHKNLLLINSLCEKYKTKLFYQFCSPLVENEIQFINDRKLSYTNFVELSTVWSFPLDRARDRCHHGPASHLMFANNVWEEVKGYF